MTNHLSAIVSRSNRRERRKDLSTEEGKRSEEFRRGSVNREGDLLEEHRGRE